MKEDFGRMSDVDGGTYWAKQTRGVSLEGAQACAPDILECLGKWFFDKTGAKLLVTSVTDGSHAGGDHSHANGWKADVSDWGTGLEKLVQSSSEPGPLVTEFLEFGASKGLGMNWEGANEGAAGREHIDVAFDGKAWSSFSRGGTGWGGGASGKNNGSASGSSRGAASSDRGFKVVPRGGEMIEITKEPSGKTFCEPIYPDYVCVSDTIPQWVLATTIEVSNSETKKDEDDNLPDSTIKAPNGKFFKQNDIDYLKNNGYIQEQAIAILSELDKYKKTDDTVKEKTEEKTEKNQEEKEKEKKEKEEKDKEKK